MATAYRQLFDNQHSSEYLNLCSTEEINSYRFWTTWEQMMKQKNIWGELSLQVNTKSKLFTFLVLILTSLVHAISKCVCVCVWGGHIFNLSFSTDIKSFSKVPSYFFNLIIQITSQTHNPINSWWIKSSPVLRLFSFIIHHITGVEWFVNTVTCWLWVTNDVL